jgi:hypothetical protein
MSLLSGWMGHASNVDIVKLQKEYTPLLADGEQLVAAYRLVRDTLVFTTHRLIIVDVQGMSGRKVSTLTVPYASITRFSKESAGTFDLDAELRIWIRGESHPIVQEFKKDNDVNAVYKLLSQAVLMK